ncbi:hypothetical protein SAMN02745823_00989 [Sporobacter termitidis DSM 10068]|uniref:Uncharacterized protein n=1 Tax=Sporobacter termitidis DSM 10068 TaxID=1123282 RepID=A0A1M5VRV6_9FIRM|nr:hypothetical protein [Sporobacter termitidis]SHH77985.1 hypothetical protein SAMN02745823_00989 [Sporobacter termitidis DSM 10068]
MKNGHDRRIENKKIEQLEIKTEPSSNADNDSRNKNHNTKKVSMGPNTKR